MDAYWPSFTTAQLVLLLLMLIPFFMRLVSAFFFHKYHPAKTETPGVIPPLAPYWFPGLYHLIPFLWSTAEFPVKTVQKYGWEQPITIKAATARLVVISNPDDVITTFKSRALSSRSISELATSHLCAVPPSVMPFYRADDSGIAAEPRKGSKVAPNNRILYKQTSTNNKWMASPRLDPLAKKFSTQLHHNLEALGIGEEWVDHPSLFDFLQVVIRANIETVWGSAVLNLNPNLVQDFCDAKEGAPGFFRGLPRWLLAKPFRARQRVIHSIEKWHEYALAHGDLDEPEWDPIWGSPYCKVREQYMLKMQPLTPRGRACEDWGFLFGLNANTHSAVFWYLLEPLKDPLLLDRMLAEVATCRTTDDTFDIMGLEKKPLLQSVFSEVLRLNVSIMVSRVVEWAPLKVRNYSVPQGDFVLMPTDAMHYNEEAWSRTTQRSSKPLSDFDAERFLIPSESGDPEYSLDGLAGLWIPFGGGERMCPGRHLAKLEMLFTLAYLFSNFDLQANEDDMDQVRPDRHFAPFSALPPTRAVRFRIRRKVKTS